jgi:hypothetical protein
MKKIILSLAVIAAAFGANAQSEENSGLKFSVGIEAALPLGNFGDAYKFGIGGSAQADYWVAPELAITGNAGYISFSGKTVSTPAYTVGGFTFPATSYKVPSIGYVPVLAGIKYKFTPEFYGSAQLGVTFATGNGASGSAFTYAPGLGYNFTENLDAVVKYTGYSAKGGGSSNTIGLRLAYTF